MEKIPRRFPLLFAALLLGLLSATTFGISVASADVALDGQFGVAGKALFDDEQYPNFVDMIVQPDGKIVVAGLASVQGNDVLLLMRYRADGTPDTTFGTEGAVTSSSLNDPYGVALQSDGKIVVAGGDGSGGFVVRFDGDGSLDTSFGTNGKHPSAPNPGAFARNVAVQPDDKIVVVGWAGSNSYESFSVSRINANGGFDSTFDVDGNSDGELTVDFGAQSAAFDLRVRPNGKVVVSGYVNVSSNPVKYSLAVAQLNADGTLDTSFGDSDGFGGYTGRIVTDPSDEGIGQGDPTVLTLQSDGKVVVAGSGPTGSGKIFVVARYDSNGALDTSFGMAGLFLSSSASGSAEAKSLAIDPEGKVVLLGVRSYNTTESVFTRLTLDGRLDTSLNGSGTFVSYFGVDTAFSALSIDGAGKFTLAGYLYDQTSQAQDGVIARYAGTDLVGTTSTTSTGDTESSSGSSPSSPTGPASAPTAVSSTTTVVAAAAASPTTEAGAATAAERRYSVNVGGVPVESTIERTSNGVRVSGGGVEVAFEGSKGFELPKSGEVRIGLSGFAARSMVAIVANDDTLGRVTVNRAGVGEFVAEAATLEAKADGTGVLNLGVRGRNSNGDPVFSNIRMSVATRTLPRTGGDSAGLMTALWIVSFGLLIVASRRLTPRR